jgi:hypothetical protein
VDFEGLLIDTECADFQAFPIWQMLGAGYTESTMATSPGCIHPRIMVLEYKQVFQPVIRQVPPMVIYITLPMLQHRPFTIVGLSLAWLQDYIIFFRDRSKV